MRLRVLIAPLLIAAVFVAGCGGGGSSTGGSSEASDGSTGAASFIKPGQENEIAKFGEEAGAAERNAANAVLEQNLAARAAGQFKLQCSSLTEAVKEGIRERAAAASVGKGCGLELAAEALTVPPSVRKNTLDEPIAALRVKGNAAYALYHGSDGKDYAMEMKNEDGVWYVASLVTREIP